MNTKATGSGESTLMYLGESYTLLGFSKTSDRVQKTSVGRVGSALRNVDIILEAQRPASCLYGKACVCLVRGPFAERVEDTPNTFSFNWGSEVACKQLEFDIVNILHTDEEHEILHGTYWKGGFIIARNENIKYEPMTAGGHIGFFRVPDEPEVYLEKTDSGIAVCLKGPCIERGMNEQQQQHVTAIKVYKKADEAYNAGDYFTAEQLFSEIIAMEEAQRGHGYPSSMVTFEVGGDERKVATEFVLNRREHDKTYFMHAMSLVKQQKYGQAKQAFTQAERRVSLEDIKGAITNTLAGIDCTNRSFALCNTKEPSEICYQQSQESVCKQCTAETTCTAFDNQAACTTYSCGKRCTWNAGVCTAVV